MGVEFSRQIQISNFMKIRPLWAVLFHVEARTCRYDEAHSRLSQFYERA